MSHCGVIKYMQKKWLDPKDIHDKVVTTSVDDGTALLPVKKWDR